MIHQEKQISLISIPFDIEVRYWMSNETLAKQIY